VADDVDILIVGGGIIGAVLMQALKPLGYRVCLVDEQASPRDHERFDARSLALSPASIAILDALSVWSSLKAHATAIDHIHVSEQGAFGQARLTRQSTHSLGMVIEMMMLNQTLDDLLCSSMRLMPATLTTFDPESNRATIKTQQGDVVLTPRLVVGADGAMSFLRQCCHLDARVKSYQQHALVANIGLARAHQNTAYERFMSDGLMAMLPMGAERMSLIWVQSPEKTQYLMALDDDAFLHALQASFGYRLGRLVKVGQRAVYPLSQTIMSKQTMQSVVFIGNAAHTLHPIAGQGFNLGLRDVAMLMQCIARDGLGQDMLEKYAKARQQDEASMVQFTDGLLGLFASPLLSVRVARRLGLTMMDNSPLLKKMITRYASGYGGVVPDLVCGIPILSHE
jgi:2-octaprenyl-6-methoxyphenol hydroxylase